MITQQYIDTVDFRLVNSKEYRINCPECDDTKFHMYINKDKRVYICHKCGARGKIADEAKDVPNLERWKEITIEDAFNRVMQKVVNENLTIKSKRTLPICYDWRINYGYKEGGTWSYLISRGVTHEEILKYDIRYVPNAKTIVFPVYNSIPRYEESGDVLKYYVCRHLDKKSKYTNAPWPKEDTLYKTDGYTTAFFDGVIVEGIFDALAIGRAGYRGIALLGKKASTQQLERLINETTKGYLIFLDDDAFTHAVELQMQLRTMANIFNRSTLKFRIMHVSKMDPAAYALKDLNELKEQLHDQSQEFNVVNTKSRM